MSQIVTAIDAELEEVEESLTRAEAEVKVLTDRRHGLAKLRISAVELNGGAPPKPKPAPKRKPAKQAPAPAVSDTERQPRAADREADNAKILAHVREHGEITVAQTMELLGVHKTTAYQRLQRLCRDTDLKVYDGKRPEGAVGRVPKVYRLNATGTSAADSDGPKTSVEHRVVDSVTTDGPIDEGTLAFSCNLSITDCRSVTSGLVRRGVLTKRVEEGVTLFEVPS